MRLLTTNFSDGYHELRLVAIEESLIETQGRKIVPLQFANEHPMPECRLKPDQALWNWQTPIVVEASMAGATRIELFHNQRLLASLEGERGELRTTSDQLGSGPVTLDVVAVLPGSPPQRVYAQPLHLEIAWPPTAQ